LLGGNITTVIASPGGSQIWGGIGNITLQGGPGNDWLAAGTGNQTLIGGGGADTLIGGAGTDSLQGGAQAVVFVPGKGFDTLTSSATGNTLDYQGAPNGVQVNLSTTQAGVPANLLDPVPGGLPYANSSVAGNTATGGWGATVNLTNAGIGTVVGTGGSDLFVSGSNDTVQGLAGNDVFLVNGGNSKLFAGNGSNSVFVFLAGSSPGDNSVSGGGNSSVDFSEVTTGTGESINLQSGAASGGFGGTQQLSGILNAVGTNYDDTLIAGGSGATIIGMNGSDHYQVGPHGGDLLETNPNGTGTGSNTFCAVQSCAIAGTAAPSSGSLANTLIGGSGNDYFFTAGNGGTNTIIGQGGFDQAFVNPTDKVSGVSQVTIE
jgi:hypothetical protein